MQCRTILGLFVAGITVASLPAHAGVPLVDETDLSQAGMYSYWRADLPVTQGDRIQQGYLVDDAIYVISEGGTVFALTAAEGLIRWGEKVIEKDYTIYRPTHALQKDGTGPVVIPTTSVIYVYHRYSGDFIQSFTPHFPISGPAAAVGTNFFMGSSDARFYSFHRWHPATMRPTKLWEVATTGPITAAPIFYGGGLLLFASQGGSVYSCYAQDKELNWSYKIPGAIIGDMAIDDQSVFVASDNRSLYRLDLGTGKFQWRHRMPRPLVEGPVVAGDTVYQFCESHGLSAIGTADGREKWHIADARSFTAQSSYGAVLLADNRDLLLVNHESGKVKHRMQTTNLAGTVQNSGGSAVFVLGKNGAVECLQLDSVPYLRRQQVNAARATLHKAPKAVRMSEAKQVTKPKPTAIDPFRSPRDGRKD